MGDFENVLVAETELSHKVAHAERRNVLELRPRVASLRIFVKVKRGHTDFLSLIDEVRARKERVRHTKSLAAFHSVFLATVSRNDTRVVVVFEVVCVPRSVVEFCLPLVERLFEFGQTERRMHPFDDYAVRVHMLERNHHIQFFLILVDVGERGFGVHKRCFAHLERVVLLDNLAVFLQIFVDMRTVVVVFHTP